MNRAEKKGKTAPKRMTTALQEISALCQEIKEIKLLLSEDYELSARAKRALKQARETPESQYVTLR